MGPFAFMYWYDLSDPESMPFSDARAEGVRPYVRHFEFERMCHLSDDIADRVSSWGEAT
jgi:hypothetical protein